MRRDKRKHKRKGRPVFQEDYEDSWNCQATKVLPNEVVWTKHAIQRVGERFGFESNIVIPNVAILRRARTVPNGEKFKLRRMQVCYVCQVQDERVYIVTVMPREMDSEVIERLRGEGKRVFGEAWKR